MSVTGPLDGYCPLKPSPFLRVRTHFLSVGMKRGIRLRSEDIVGRMSHSLTEVADESPAMTYLYSLW